MTNNDDDDTLMINTFNQSEANEKLAEKKNKIKLSKEKKKITLNKKKKLKEEKNSTKVNLNHLFFKLFLK